MLRRNMETLSVQGWAKAVQRPSGIESGEGYEGQQKGLLHMSSKSKSRGNVYLLHGAGDLLTKDMQEAEIMEDAFFTLVFTGVICLKESQSLPASGRVWSKEDLPSVEEDHVRNI